MIYPLHIHQELQNHVEKYIETKLMSINTRQNTIVTGGIAVLGLRDIGPVFYNLNCSIFIKYLYLFNIGIFYCNYKRIIFILITI